MSVMAIRWSHPVCSDYSSTPRSGRNHNRQEDEVSRPEGPNIEGFLIFGGIPPREVINTARCILPLPMADHMSIKWPKRQSLLIMASRCTVCDKTVRQNQQVIGCDQCDRWTHRSCVPGSGQSRMFFMHGACMVPNCLWDTSALVSNCLNILWRGRSVQQTVRH